MITDLENWREGYERSRRRPDYPRVLVEEANALFEENEDLELALIGGLAVQEFYSTRRVRITSDIDLVASSEKLVGRLKENGYRVRYNRKLDKYSALYVERLPSQEDIYIYMDIYPRRVDSFEIDEILFQHTVEPEGYSLRLASPEDLTVMKLISFLRADRGKNKHFIDICTMLASPKVDFNLKYLRERLETKIPESIPHSFVVKTLVNPPKNVLQQFSSKERRIIGTELERIEKELFKIKL